jgi:hypothetical protein
MVVVGSMVFLKKNEHKEHREIKEHFLLGTRDYADKNNTLFRNICLIWHECSVYGTYTW